MSGFWTDAAVREALGLEPAAGAEPRPDFSGVSTDTRTLGRGSLFVALRGERFDAHGFLGAAAEAGAAGAIVEEIPADAPPGLVYYTVPDTLEALGLLARHYRRHLGARTVAIVGSNGKTTTKELTRAALATTYRVHATTANLNNLIGVPLTILSAPADTEALVVEVGTNAPGEVARMGAVVEPDAVIVTSIAEEHLEGLGDLEGVLEEETSILRFLPADGAALVAEEPEILPGRAHELASRVRVAGWGAGADPDLRAVSVGVDDAGRTTFRWRGEELHLSLLGRINARNALLALGLAEEWGVPQEEAVVGVAGVEPPEMRGEVVEVGGLTVIADCYNANPASVEAAVELLVSLPRGAGRVAFLGTMKELGESSAELHRGIAEGIVSREVDLIVATGEFADAFDRWADELGDRLIRADDPIAAYEPLRERLRGGEVILLKGSRGVALERLLPRLESDFGGAAMGAGATGSVGGDADQAVGE